MGFAKKIYTIQFQAINKIENYKKIYILAKINLSKISYNIISKII